MENITNIKELRISLTENYSKLKAKKLPIKMAHELSYTAGKILRSIQVELNYNEQNGNKKDIDFMNY